MVTSIALYQVYRHSHTQTCTRNTTCTHQHKASSNICPCTLSKPTGNALWQSWVALIFQNALFCTRHSKTFLQCVWYPEPQRTDHGAEVPAGSRCRRIPVVLAPQTHWCSVIFMVGAAVKQRRLHFQVSKQLLKLIIMFWRGKTLKISF